MKRYFLPMATFAAVGLAGAIAHAQEAQQFDPEGEAEMLARIGAMRSAQGVPVVSRDPQLDQAARLHCADMASHQALEHVSARTGTPGDRVRRAGVTVSTIAENVALHRTTAEAFESLLGSEAHRANMVDARFTHVGIGALRTARGVYVTQVFAAVAAPQAAPPEPPAPPPPALPAPSVETLEPWAAGTGPAVAQAPEPPRPALPRVELSESSPVRPPVEGRTYTPTMVNGAFTVLQRAPDQRVEAYWVFGAGRWWYYPMPEGAQPGQRLAHDPTVSGPPPGFPANPGAGGPPMAQAAPGYPMPTAQPAPGVQAVQPQDPRGGASYRGLPPEFAGRPQPRTRQEQREWMLEYRRYLQQHPEARRRRM